MEKADMIDSIKTELGYPVITLYITDEMISKLIDKAIRKCSGKASPIFTVEKTISSGMVSLAGLNVEAVKEIYASTSSSTNQGNLFDSSFYSYDRGNLMNMLADIGSNAEMERLVLPDFYLDGDNLYVDNYSGNVTIEYIKKDLDFADLDVEWRGWVESYATALTKLAEAKIRGKFKPQNAPFETDASDLMSEGQSAVSELESRLDMSVGYFNIIR